jgi:hypothetical protein
MACLSASSPMPVIVTLGVGLVGAFAGAVAKWYFDTSINRQRNAFDLHRELHSDAFRTARSAAWAYLRKNPRVQFEDIRIIEEDTKETNDTKDALQLWKVMHFFHRVASASNHGFMAQSLVFELFGELLIWWYVILFRDKLPKDKWQAGRVIEQMYLHLKIEADNDPYKADIWELWHGLAEKDRQDGKLDQPTDTSRPHTAPSVSLSSPQRRALLIKLGREKSVQRNPLEWLGLSVRFINI